MCCIECVWSRSKLKLVAAREFWLWVVDVGELVEGGQARALYGGGR
jgi:hypothetical protein